jgi:xylitol oxidase
MEAALEPFDARPHWGKVFVTPRERVTGAYARWADFERLRASFDPAGKFGNEFVDRFFSR